MIKYICDSCNKEVNNLIKIVLPDKFEKEHNLEVCEFCAKTLHDILTLDKISFLEKTEFYKLYDKEYHGEFYMVGNSDQGGMKCPKCGYVNNVFTYNRICACCGYTDKME